jgi:hypothetical protein
MDKEWEKFTSNEKRNKRFNRWLSPINVKFINSEAEKTYKQKVTRFIKTINFELPDRVPFFQPVEYYPAFYAGSNLKTVMYDYDRLRFAWLKFLQDFEFDSFSPPGLVAPGRALDMIGYKLYKWPGRGLPDNATSSQYVEDEYMLPNEYDDLIKDPIDYLMRYFFPRSSKSLEAFSKLGRFAPFDGIPFGYLAQFGNPDIRTACQTLMDAGQECANWMKVITEISEVTLARGTPYEVGGLAQAPFDMIGDTLRGTKGVMMDMYQRPEKLLEAMERLVPIIVDEGVSAADNSGCPIVVFGLHKGPAGFMSNKQFAKFYWPTLKKVMLGLIDEGVVPLAFAEGNYEPRLEIIKDMPKASLIWYFEQMNMAKAKEVLGGNVCIAGNLPASVLCLGTPQEVKEHCRYLIDTCGKGGGYILAASMHLDECNPDNLHAMIEAVKEYGVYVK